MHSICPSLVFDTQRCVMMSRYYRHPRLPPAHPPIQTPFPIPTHPFPCLLVHMQRKEASPLWQQQNTELQKRCAPLTVTIKKGVDRIRAGDDDLRGRDVQEEVRRKEKGLSFLTLPLSSYFFSFIFPKIHQVPLDICLTEVTLISPEGRVPFLLSVPLLHRALSFFPSIYISKQAMSRSKTVTNDEAFHQWLAWNTEIVYSQVSLIISRWVCCLAMGLCARRAPVILLPPSLSLGARCC